METQQSVTPSPGPVSLFAALNAGKKIEYDGANMKITNAPQAEQFLKRQYRQGWSLS